MAFNIQDLLNSATFKPLEPGNYTVQILSWTPRFPEGKDSYIEFEFAPSDNLEHKHKANLFGTFTQSLANNLQRIIDEPGLTGTELFNTAIGLEIPASFEITVDKTDSTKRYYNWHLGYHINKQIAPTAKSLTPARK